MKKFFQLSILFLGILMSQYAFSDSYTDQGCGYQDGYSCGQVMQDNSCATEQACPQEQACNDCWCLYCRYEPCNYCTQRCECYQVPCKKRCCTFVPQYYEVQRCRYVPQYYTVTYCRNVPQYYYTTEYKTCKRWVTDRHCKYVPKYYWKHTCQQNSCAPCQ